MQNIFDEVGSLDQRCYEEFGLTEDILMEHAADGMADFIRKNFSDASKVLIVCGSGNNGADGLALARLLHREYGVKVLLAKEPRSEMAKLQYERCVKLGVSFTENVEEADIIVDAILGTGFRGELPAQLHTLIAKLNAAEGVKIACDIPSAYIYRADYTLTMGGLKKSMFEDSVKDVVGEISVLNLGVARAMYETHSDVQLLDEDDLQLPHRKKQNVHKGSFGHLSVVCGEKKGAAVLSGSAALRFGAALVTLVSNESVEIPFELMHSHHLPHNTTAIALGMGLGVEFSIDELEVILNNELPLILDADIFYHPLISTLLKRKNVVLTPHPKEFVQLLHVSGVCDVSVTQLQQNRFEYVELFMQHFPHVTLLLKGANVLIAHEKRLHVNPHGSSILAKGGSGDVLSGLVGALLAQGYTPYEAAIHASLAHTKLAKLYTGADFSLTPNDLIGAIGKL